MRFSEIFVETVKETQDVLVLSKAIMDYIYANELIIPGSVIEVSNIPGLPKPVTPEGQTLINSTRIKVVDPSIWTSQGKKAPAGSAAPFYTDTKGNYGDRVYPDVRMSRDVRAGQYPALPTDSDWARIVDYKAGNGYKMDIKLNASMMDQPGGRARIQSTLTHELSHHLDTLKGMNTVADWDRVQDRAKIEDKLKMHQEAKKLVTPENPNPPGLLDPKEEKKLIGQLKSLPVSSPDSGSRGYYADRSEVNARLMQSAETMTEPKWMKFLTETKNVDEFIKHALNAHNIAIAFVKYPSEEAFQAALISRQVTAAEWKEAMANPEFQQIYKRIYKFLTDEQMAGGLISQFQKQNLAAFFDNTGKKTFLERFQQVVIKGVEAVKDVAKQVVRRYAQGTVALEKIIVKMIPEFMAKSGFKSIPLIGILFGVAFAIPRLFKGDAPGAGIEVASSVGSLFTVIPLVAYQIARDLYGEEYMYSDTGKPAVLEYDYANDPEGTKERIAELQDKIAKILKEKLQQNAPNYPMVFSNTAGGAAVGNPKIAAQGERSRSNRPTPEPIPTQPANGRGPGLGADVPGSIANIAQQSTKRP